MESLERFTAVNELDPRSFPEIGFQSYEMLKNDGLEQRDAFVNNKVHNPHVTYPEFSGAVEKMDNGIAALTAAIERVEESEKDPQMLEAIRSSLDYRRIEKEYIKTLARLDQSNNFEEQDALAAKARMLNTELYGEPNPETVKRARAEVWAQISEKQLSTGAAMMARELEEIYGFAKPDSRAQRLPDLGSSAALDWAGEQMLAANSDIEALVNDFWLHKVAENGTDYVCEPHDIQKIFEQVIALRDPENTMQLRAILEEGATALSWDSSRMAVIIGAKRTPIQNVDELTKKIFHEFGVHGQRAINGAKTGVIPLATGLFTNTLQPDYLTYEEGVAVLLEAAIGSESPKWNAGNLAYTLNIDAAQNGKDFRGAYEQEWRRRVLMNLNDNEEPSEAFIAKHKNAAYGSVMRVFRGTPIDRADTIGSLTYNKDLAYLEGRIIAIKHLDRLYENRDGEGFQAIFAGKYDPTNEVQAKIMARAIAKNA